MGNAPKDASTPPERAAEDEDILKLLNSAAWEKRLDAARQQRERILADRAKSGAPRKPTLFPKAVPPDRMPVLENGQAKAPRTAANRPAPAAKSSAASKLPTLPKVVENPANEPVVAARAKVAAIPAPPLPPPEPAKVARRPITPVRVALGFGLGLVVGVGISSVSWFFKSDPVNPSGASQASASVAPAADEVVNVAATVAPEPEAIEPQTDMLASVSNAPDNASDLSNASVALSDPPEVAPTVNDITGPGPTVALILDTPSEPEIDTSEMDALQSPTGGETSLPASEPSPFQPDIPMVAPLAELPPDTDLPGIRATDLGTIPHAATPAVDATMPGKPSEDVALASIDPAPALPVVPDPPAGDEVKPDGVAAYPPHQVVIYVPENADRNKVATEQGNLTTAGFNVDQPRAIDLKIKKDQVRFYHDEDRVVADAVAQKIGAEARDFTTADNRPPAGTIEVWFAGDGPKVAASEPGKPPATKKKKQQAKPQGPSESQQLQMLRDRIVSQLKKGEYN